MTMINPWFGIIITIILLIQGIFIPKNKIVFCIQSIWLIILTCFNTGGGDWGGNEGIYWLAQVNNNKNFLENLYPFLISCFRNEGASFIVFNGIMSFFASLIILFIIYKKSINRNLVLSFWLIFPLIDNIIQKRAYYGLSLVILALSFLMDSQRKISIRNMFIFEVLVVIAYEIHSMYCLYFVVPFYLLLNYKWQKCVSILGVIIGFIFKGRLQLAVNTIMGVGISNKSDLYFNQLAATASLTHTLFWMVWQISQLAIILYINRKISNTSKNSLLLSLNWWGLLLIPLYSFNPVFTRVFRAIILFNYIAVADTFIVRNRRFIGIKPLIVVVSEFTFVILTFYMMDVNTNGLVRNVYPIFQYNSLLNMLN